MAIKLLYRIDMVNPPVPAAAAVKSAPLTMLEIDGNMKAISNAFDSTDDHFAQVDAIIETLAPKDRPQFNEYIILPLVQNGTFPGEPTEGMMVYDLSTRTVQVYFGAKDNNGNKVGWQSLATALTLSQYVKSTGDVMTGKLEGVSAEFRDHVKVLPPDASIGEPTDTVATIGWVTNQARTIVEQRLHDNGSVNLKQGDITIDRGDININLGNITVANGVVIANRLQGHLDMGDMDDKNNGEFAPDIENPSDTPINGNFVTSAEVVSLIKQHTSTSGYRVIKETVSASAYYLDYFTYTIFDLTLQSTRTAIQFASVVETTGRGIQIQLFLRQGTGANTVTWPPNVIFANGQLPVLSTTKGMVDIIQLTSVDDGKTWFGSQLDSWV